jgi:general secretion pathway protein L
LTTLIVQLPPRDPAVPAQEWRLPALPFVLLDKRGRTMRSGTASVALLPRASATVALVAARDTLLLRAKLPPVKGLKLRQILPNVVEDQIIQDPQTCHIAVDPEPAVNDVKMLAVIDRGWFRFLTEAFAQAGHRSVRMVPLTAGLPVADDSALSGVPSVVTALPDEGEVSAEVEVIVPASERNPERSPKASVRAERAAAEQLAASAALESTVPVVALLLGAVVPTDSLLAADATFTPGLAQVSRIELAIARGRLGEGMAVPANALDATLEAVAAGAPLTVYRLTAVPGGEPDFEPRGFMPGAGPAGALSQAHRALPLPFETFVRTALTSRFDLCQFEFSSQGWRPGRRAWREWRMPVMLLAATAVVMMIGMNIQWLMLAHERDAIVSQQTETLLSAFPRTTVVLDPASQMTRQLDQLRLAAGELSPGDFESLAAGLSRSLGTLPSNAIASLGYRERVLTLAFKPDVRVDKGFANRLNANGLDAKVSDGKWTIKSAVARGNR